jgi:diaminohydroxyphosphoribosylaminopyrimidine deaminase/5-amino-6-(5-phosphoribosylamino)uracil reductase
MVSLEDNAHMARALLLAERGRGRTSPNPMVGAVVVDEEGIVIGRGTHEFAGGPHAEIRALADAADRARGATLYCTLEPCCHTGRTGPCAPRVVAAGIRRVVVAVEDPNPRVSGRGLDYLRAHGVDVCVGPLGIEAERLNRPFFTLMRLGRPLVTMKAALSLDARVAARRGHRTTLTGLAATCAIHRERAEIDAIAVGSETVLVDDPLLTARSAYRYRPLVRVVFDRRLRTPVTSRLLSTLAAGPVIIVSTPSAQESTRARAEALTDAGAQLELLEPDDDTSDGFLRAALVQLGRRGVTSLVVEGGPTLHEAFWRGRFVDRVELYVSPKIVGPNGVEWSVMQDGSLAELMELTARPVGEDVLIEGYVHRPD